MAHDLAIQFAKFEGSMTAEMKNLSHDVRNLTQSLTSFVTQREFAKEIEVLQSRVSALEGHNSWFTRSVLSAFGGVAVTLLTGFAAWKLGIHP